MSFLEEMFINIGNNKIWESKNVLLLGITTDKDLTLIWVGFLGVRLEVGGWGGVKLPPSKTRHNNANYGSLTLQFCTHPYIVSENIPFNTKTLLILLMSAFLFCLQKINVFLVKIVPLLKPIV